MPPSTILILGGTGEARQLAAELMARGHRVVTSLAGVTQSPVLPAGDVRIGGFGGTAGLLAYVQSNHIAAIADVSHPFAQQISSHGHEAAASAGIPYIRLERDAWPNPGDGSWTEVAGIGDAVAVLPAGARAMVTIGRKAVDLFFGRSDLSGVARMIEAPLLEVPARWQIILARPPFDIAGERAILVEHRITHLVSKNAGGDDTAAKLSAARALRLPVIMVRRPTKPGLAVHDTVAACATALDELISA